jgi:hypothetical protein
MCVWISFFAQISVVKKMGQKKAPFQKMADFCEILVGEGPFFGK